MVFRIVQGDTAPPITSRLADGNDPVDLSNVSNVFFHMQDQFKRVIVNDDLTGRVNIVDASVGEVEYVFSSSDTENIGTYTAEWQVLYDDGKIETFPSQGKLTIEIGEEIE